MALLFADSFDHYNLSDSTDITSSLMKYWEGTEGSAITIVDGVNPTSYAVRLNAATKILRRFIPSQPDEIIVGFWFRRGATGSATNFFNCSEGPGFTTTRQVGLFLSAANFIEVRTGLGSGTLVATGTKVIAANTWYFIEARIKIANAGTVTVKVNRNTDISFSGDTLPNTNVFTNQIHLVGTTQVNDFDDFYLCDISGSVANNFLTSSGNGGSVRVTPLYPNDVGDEESFDTSDGTDTGNFNAVSNAFPDDDESYVEIAGAGRDLYNIDPLPHAGTVVFGVQHNLYAKKSGPANKTLKRSLKTNSTVYSGTTFGVTEQYYGVSEAITLNPNTSAQWTRTQVNDLQIGMEV